MTTPLAFAFPAAKALHLIHPQPRLLTLTTSGASIRAEVELFEIKKPGKKYIWSLWRGRDKSIPLWAHLRTLTASAVAPRVLAVSTRALNATKAKKGPLKLRTRPGAVSEIRTMAIRVLSPTRGHNLLLPLLFKSPKMRA
jgi:hypothetical protein